MPKVVDSEERRKTIVEALWRVVQKDGIRNATVRTVAAEAGVSPGRLRHYFNDQSELLSFAVESMTQRVTGRLRDRVDELRGGLKESQLLLEEMLPLDSNRRIEAVVWLEAITQARSDPALSHFRVGWAGERLVCEAAWANVRGLPLPSLNSQLVREPSEEAAIDALHTFVDGLTLQAVTYPDELTADQVRHRLLAFFTSLLSAAT